ncbi:MAG: DMT family transporter [Clostridia bacterium]|nr:DMT family transporter [Clostridia bacterium]
MKQKKALIFIILAGLLWGSSCLFVSALKPYGFTSLQMTGMRGILAGIGMTVYGLLVDRKCFRVKLPWLFVFACNGICLFLTAFFYYSAMPLTGTPTAVILMYTSTIFVMIFSVVVWRERFTTLKAISVVCMLAGCCLVSGIVGGLKLHLVGMIFALGSGLTYTTYNILTKFSARHGQNAVSVTVYGFLTMSVISLFVVEPQETFPIIASDPLKILPLILGMGICTFIVPYFLYTLSLQDLDAGTAASLGVVEPMAATVYSVIFLREPMTVYSVIGVLLVLIAVVLLGKTENANAAKKLDKSPDVG